MGMEEAVGRPLDDRAVPIRHDHVWRVRRGHAGRVLDRVIGGGDEAVVDEDTFPLARGRVVLFDQLLDERTADPTVVSPGNDRRWRTLQRKRSYFWNTIGDFTLKIDY